MIAKGDQLYRSARTGRRRESPRPGLATLEVGLTLVMDMFSYIVKLADIAGGTTFYQKW